MEGDAAQSTHPLVVVCGPTATGKSDVAQALALRTHGAVLSADSMQVYTGMNIGTAKVPEHKRRVPHFGLDLAEPDESYSVALYQRYARDVIAQAAQRNQPIVMAGGTGLYIQAAIDDLHFPEGEEQLSPVRRIYEHMAREHGAQAVWDALNELDSASAKEIHPHNTKRVIRALEMAEYGQRYADRAHGLTAVAQVIPAVWIGLVAQRPVLYDRINKRVDRMREEGLVAEVERLAHAGFAQALTAKQAIGYKEVLAALAGVCTMDEAFDQIKQASRRYAKRQLTWFRRNTRIHWIDVTEIKLDEAAEMANTLIEHTTAPQQ